ncbi:MAG TPA: DUF2326 domain-containing protein [Candidatus Paceibacterota bacterium]|nr:DUF2326 domain-containing protein [Candidatus Paceibacterota bacterium]
MIKLKKLYSIPQTFDPIEFRGGINLILGEKVSEEKTVTRKDRKTNGVGKSMSVEFINFCLFKGADSSRVMKIPFDKFAYETRICLDLLINHQKVTIERTIHEPDKPSIEVDGEITLYKSADEALQYLTNLFYAKNKDEEIERPSFRELIGPLIRDENSEFKDIVNCYDLRAKIPNSDLIKTHLYLFGINPCFVREIKGVLKDVEEKSQTQSHLRKRLTDSGKKKISDVKAELNALELELSRVEDSLNKFRTEPVFQQNQETLVKIDSSIEQLRTKQIALRYELKRIESMPKVESVNTSDIQIVYDKFKDGLGEIVSKSINEVVDFKKKIEKYQNLLINERADEIRAEIKKIQEDLNSLDEQRAEMLIRIDKKDSLSVLKESFYSFTKRKDELASTQSNLDEYELVERQMDTLKLKKDNLFSELDTKIFEINKQIKDFNKTVAEIHNYIMGNAEVSFDISTVKTSSSKQIIKLDFRIPDDRSHSVDRTKVFIYDIGLLMNKNTKHRHPMFLIHDNIFDVDQDTLIQSLNFLAEQEEKMDFQYVLTLNRDKIENEERKKQIKLKIPEHTIASFNRRERFLKADYKELD